MGRYFPPLACCRSAPDAQFTPALRLSLSKPQHTLFEPFNGPCVAGLLPSNPPRSSPSWIGPVSANSAICATSVSTAFLVSPAVPSPPPSLVPSLSVAAAETSPSSAAGPARYRFSDLELRPDLISAGRERKNDHPPKRNKGKHQKRATLSFFLFLSQISYNDERSPTYLDAILSDERGAEVDTGCRSRSGKPRRSVSFYRSFVRRLSVRQGWLAGWQGTGGRRGGPGSERAS